MGPLRSGTRGPAWSVRSTARSTSEPTIAGCCLHVLPGGAFTSPTHFSRIIRLGEGVSQTGRLSEAAMTRTMDALRVCAGKI